MAKRLPVEHLDEATIASRLNLDHIEAAATWAAGQLVAETGAVLVTLTPGDYTQYVLLIVNPGIPRWYNGEQLTKVERHEYIVTLLGSGGAGYPWSGDYVDPVYASEKWTSQRGQWTGVVVSRFLNALGTQIDALDFANPVAEDPAGWEAGYSAGAMPPGPGEPGWIDEPSVHEAAAPVEPF